MYLLKEVTAMKRTTLNDFLNMVDTKNKAKKALYVHDEISVWLFNIEVKKRKGSRDFDLILSVGKQQIIFHLVDLVDYDDSYAYQGSGLYAFTFKSGAKLCITY